MHGLILKSFEGFLRSNYGEGLWHSLVLELNIDPNGFEPLFRYDLDLADKLTKAAAKALDKPPETLLEDFGTFLVIDRRVDRVRRLLRFGGINYTEFLYSLEELRGRAHLAVPDLNLPQIEVDECDASAFIVTCCDVRYGMGHVLLGVLRALADDYGTLAYLEFQGRKGGDEVLSVQLLDMTFSKGREFQLASGGDA